jgi:hypothetical protein
MQKHTWIERSIAIGCLVFIGILFYSAYWDPSIRWLHFFQAWLYLAIIVLTWQRSRWGYFLGIVTAAFWTYGALCLNTFFHAGREQLVILLETGNLPRPDLFISVPAVLANLTIVGCCLWGYLRLAERHLTDAARFVACAVISIGYFAGIIALFQPRYLGMFTRVFSPHLTL